MEADKIVYNAWRDSESYQVPMTAEDVRQQGKVLPLGHTCIWIQGNMQKFLLFFDSSRFILTLLLVQEILLQIFHCDLHPAT